MRESSSSSANIWNLVPCFCVSFHCKGYNAIDKALILIKKERCKEETLCTVATHNNNFTHNALERLLRTLPLSLYIITSSWCLINWKTKLCHSFAWMNSKIAECLKYWIHHIFSFSVANLKQMNCKPGLKVQVVWLLINKLFGSISPSLFFGSAK